MRCECAPTLPVDVMTALQCALAVPHFGLSLICCIISMIQHVRLLGQKDHSLPCIEVILVHLQTCKMKLCYAVQAPDLLPF